jgi:hypothetical protein
MGAQRDVDKWCDNNERLPLDLELLKATRADLRKHRLELHDGTGQLVGLYDSDAGDDGSRTQYRRGLAGEAWIVWIESRRPGATMN